MAPSVDDLRAHVEALCEKYLIACYVTCRRLCQAYSLRECDEIIIAPIRSLLSYATALHEIGHHRGHHQNSRRVMVRERWAWHWARRNALVWTPTMELGVSSSLAWYASRADKIDKKWRPPEILVDGKLVPVRAQNFG
jgi:hypothetical protein